MYRIKYLLLRIGNSFAYFWAIYREARFIADSQLFSLHLGFVNIILQLSGKLKEFVQLVVAGKGEDESREKSRGVAFVLILFPSVNCSWVGEGYGPTETRGARGTHFERLGGES